MSTAAAISVIASTQAAVASLQAREAKVLACKSYMPTFNGSTATISDARTYADCVDLVYPEPIGGPDILVIKGLIILMLVGIAVGFYKGWKEDGLIFGFLGALMGGIFFPCCAILVFGIGHAAWWLVT